MEVERKKYCVDGEWRRSATEKWMPVTDSSTGEVIAEVPCCTVDEVESAIASAQAAFPQWSQIALSARTQLMFKWRNVLLEHLDELTVLCAKELGKIWMRPEATCSRPSSRLSMRAACPL